MARRNAVICGVLMLVVIGMVAAGCAPGQLAISTTSPTPQSECGRTPGTAGTWRPALGYCEY
jgi:hypothetical protein